VIPVSHLKCEPVDVTELFVVGGSTHAHGMSRVNTRKAAVDAASKPGASLALESDAECAGVREWLATLRQLNIKAAAFDTRMTMPAFLSGRASRGIAKALRGHGVTMVAKPESFLVTEENRPLPGEEECARVWGRQLATAIAGTAKRSA
jgi:hypothetical protein